LFAHRPALTLFPSPTLFRSLTVEVFMSINETFRAVEAHGERRPDATGLRDGLASTHKGLFGIIGAIESTLTRDDDAEQALERRGDRKSTRLNSSHRTISYAV